MLDLATGSYDYYNTTGNDVSILLGNGDGTFGNGLLISVSDATVTIPRGAIYHVRSKRRCEVEFSATLREQTAEAAAHLHELLAAGGTPAPVLHRKCQQCSLHDLCLPELIAAPTRYERAAAALFQVPEA